MARGLFTVDRESASVDEGRRRVGGDVPGVIVQDVDFPGGVLVLGGVATARGNAEGVGNVPGALGEYRPKV